MNKVYGCIIFYNDGVEMLSRAFTSCKRANLPIIAIDGKFKEFEGPSTSDKAHIDFCKEWFSKNEGIFIEGGEYEDQMAKRNHYLNICKNWGADYCFIIDADEELIHTDIDWDLLTEDTYMTCMTDVSDVLWYLHTIRIHKITSDLEYRHRHSFLYHTDKITNPKDVNSGLKKREFKDMYLRDRSGDPVIIKHYATHRSRERQTQDEKYVKSRSEFSNNCNIAYDHEIKTDERPVTLECTAPKGYNGQTFGFQGEIGVVPYWKYIQLINNFSPLWFKVLKIEEQNA